MGCKVNQYDTRAMVGLFAAEGYVEVSFDTPADVVLVNTCTVTGEGDRKSRQCIGKARRLNPSARIIVCGCLAQRKPETLMLDGVALILGTQRRREVVRLLEEAAQSDTTLLAVDNDFCAEYEPLTNDGGAGGKTRAIIKIEEGCDCHCAYCVIPSVRGGVRSRPLRDIEAEARKLGEAGFKEIVITGINLSRYGADFTQDTTDSTSRASLADAVRVVAEASRSPRIRISSLEPAAINERFVDEMSRIPTLCPHFHVSLQSGCDAVLSRMNRRYTAGEYAVAVNMLRSAYTDKFSDKSTDKFFDKDAAITTDILMGFPGETDDEFEQTLAFARETGFSRLHVFPFSAREGTAAAAMVGQVPVNVRRERAAKLIELGKQLEEMYINRKIGSVSNVLFEQGFVMEGKRGAAGYTGDYVRVFAVNAVPGEIMRVRLKSQRNRLIIGELTEP